MTVVNRQTDDLIVTLSSVTEERVFSIPPCGPSQIFQCTNKQNPKVLLFIKGSPQERQVVVMCRQLGINDTKLTPEKFQVMIRLLGKSKHLNIPKGKLRKKRK